MWAIILKFLMFCCFTILLPLSVAGAAGGGGCQRRGPLKGSFQPSSLWVPAPTGGVLFPRRKSTQKGAGETPDPLFFVQSVSIRLDPAQPLNQRLLRASDLRRASRPASAVALLKGTTYVLYLFFGIPFQNIAGLTAQQSADHVEILHRDTGLTAAKFLQRAVCQQLLFLQPVAGIPGIPQCLQDIDFISYHSTIPIDNSENSIIIIVSNMRY